MKHFYNNPQIGPVMALRLEVQTAKSRLAMWYQRKAVRLLTWVSNQGHSSSPEVLKNIEKMARQVKCLKKNIAMNQFIVDCNTLMKHHKFDELDMRIKALLDDADLRG